MGLLLSHKTKNIHIQIQTLTILYWTRSIIQWLG